MGVIKSASSSSWWRGLEYYKKDKVIDLNKISEKEYTSKVIGTEKYNVYLNLEHVRKSTCNCSLANGKRIICKHIVATYFKVFLKEAINFEKEQEKLEKEYVNYQEKLYKKTKKYIRSMSRKDLINELSYVLDYGPEWLYDDFVRRNDIG